jgi:hypothetical protein
MRLDPYGSWEEAPPTEPGWYWYEDENYGPAPVEVAWTGFVARPEARQLQVVTACGEDSYQPIGDVADLDGRWWAIPVPSSMT